MLVACTGQVDAVIGQLFFEPLPVIQKVGVEVHKGHLGFCGYLVQQLVANQDLFRLAKVLQKAIQLFV